MRILKIALPVTALAATGIFATSILKLTGFGSGIPEIAMPQILPENLAMENPHYEGFNADGGRYWVKAARAIQDLQTLGSIKLEGITGELTDAQKVKTRLAAARGTFNNRTNLLELFDTIDITGENGLTAKLARASVQTKEGIITSDQPVSVAMQAGAITSNQMTIRQKVKEYTFVDSVRTVLTPKPKTDTADQSATPQPFGSSEKPIEITSNRLDINDGTKVAMFTGQVVAMQEGASLTAPELEVTYENNATNIAEAGPKTPAAATAQATPKVAATDPAASGRLKRIVARTSIELKQASGETVTGQTLDFDAATQKAVVDGNVVVVQGTDRRAIGDRVEFDQTTDTVLMTGAVVLTQGGNEMRGNRLTFDRPAGKMQLTAPTGSGGNGRIFAKFKQDGGSAKAAQTDTAAPAQGISFGASFKTTPGAPISVESARLDVDDANKNAVFTGDVKAIQGEFIIRAAALTAKYSGSAGMGSATEVVKGAPAQLTRLRANERVKVTSGDGQTATGDWADFDPKSNLATLGGDVVLTQGKNVVRGTKLVIDMTSGQATIKTEAAPLAAGSGATSNSATGTATAESAPQGRPSAVFYPSDMKARQQQKQAKPAAGTAAGTGKKSADGGGWEARSEP